MSTPLWNLNSVVLRGSDRHRLDGVTCSIEPGVTAILGSSGAGKTSLLNVLAGMESPDSGTVQRQFDAPAGGLPLYWAPQGGGLWPHLTVRQHLTEVGKDGESADKLLNQFDLQDRHAALPGSLSQGERARTAIARALAVPVHVLLFDEPLVHVDGDHKTSGWQTIRTMIQQAGTHLVLTTHEADVVLREADSVLCLADGRLAWTGPVRQLYSTPPSAAIGRFLGPLNWFDADEQQHWLPSRDRCSDARCLRPEHLQLVPSFDDSPSARVVDSRFMGDRAETTLQRDGSDHTITVIHRPVAALNAGETVSLRLTTPQSEAGGTHV